MAPDPGPQCRRADRANVLLVQAEALSFGYPDVPLFHGLEFQVGPGLSLVLGGDGRGKTSLLCLMAGVLAPQAGRLHRASASVLMVPGHPEADQSCTARDWLQAQARRLPAWQSDQADRLVAAFALGEHLHKSLFMLSAGTHRKLWLVVAFAGGAELTLMDMPFAALDARSREALAACLMQVAADTRRAWVVADAEWPPGLADVPLATRIDLGD